MAGSSLELHIVEVAVIADRSENAFEQKLRNLTKKKEIACVLAEIMLHL